jgi:hypothetical protein
MVPTSHVRLVINNLSDSDFYILNTNPSTLTNLSSAEYNVSTGNVSSVQFCSLGNTTLVVGNNYTFTTSLSGTNADQYMINYNTLPASVNLELNPAPSISPSFGGITFPNGTTNGSYTILSNIDATFYYYVRDPNDNYDPKDPLNLT